MKYIRKAYLGLLIFLLASCNEKITDNLIGNVAPETFISLYPDTEISKQQSKVQVHWWGDDPDGLIVGYYFTWDNVNWHFSSSNDSTFALQIGAKDTSYYFKVSAVDNSGNGVYDNSIIQNGINYGPEPYIDKNKNGVYDPNDSFIDIGVIDPTPAQIKYPIKNSAPVVEWNALSVLPDTSFPVMSFGWEASDIDGDETIQKINISLNDTTKYISIPGTTRLILIRVKDYSTTDYKAEILINGLESNIYSAKLAGIKLNDNNIFYIQAEDISGAKSKFIPLPGENKKWFVKKPAGKLLVLDDYQTTDNAQSFYKMMFDSVGNSSLKNKYDVWDLAKNKVPYETVTFYETLKLFKYLYWYTDNNPSLTLANLATKKFVNSGGKIFFSVIFPQTIDQSELQSFLPIDSAGTINGKNFTNSLIGNSVVSVSDASLPYPVLKTSTTIFRIRTFYPLAGSAIPVYNVESTMLTTNKVIAFRDIDKKIFFIGLPLNKTNSIQTNVKTLLEKVFIDDFGLTP